MQKTSIIIRQHGENEKKLERWLENFCWVIADGEKWVSVRFCELYREKQGRRRVLTHKQHKNASLAHCIRFNEGYRLSGRGDDGYPRPFLSIRLFIVPPPILVAQSCLNMCMCCARVTVCHFFNFPPQFLTPCVSLHKSRTEELVEGKTARERRDRNSIFPPSFSP